ncbi:MAG: VCBS repeat-containing protein [Firmicutes bacterium]|nr:VCBS repeat-containing protein [Bacillota bacterium]
MNNVIADFKIGDVNGDKIPDYIYLTGKKEIDSNFIYNLKLTVKDGFSGKCNIYPLEFDGGYNPQIFLGDFNNMNVNDIFLSIPTGGSGGYIYYYLFSYLNNNLFPLFDDKKFNKGLNFDINYENNYKVRVSNDSLDKTFIIDVSNKKDLYEELNIYDDNGMLIKPTKGTILYLGGLFPIQYSLDNSFELLAKQRIIGISNADTLGYVNSLWKYKDKKMHLLDVTISILG